MCGIAGFIDVAPADESQLRHVAGCMADQLFHRGPDDCGTWVDARAGLAFGFRRLAILDLTVAGHQPMLSASGRFAIVFNGEVYNFLTLREELESKGHKFRGYSDTEVMLAALEEWGVEAAVKKFVGMFAFALWDRQDRTLHLVRDRLGIKPLYYGWSGKAFCFGSELKALRAFHGFNPEIDRDALALQMRHAYIPHPYTIYKGIHSLTPGSILTLKCASGCAEQAEPKPYWSAKEVTEQALADPFRGSEGEAIEQLDSLLRDSVRLRMIADVPLGAFLSGGIDSSTVVALMQAQSSRPVRTFTIGFHEDEYNEASHARAVAAHLGTQHTELYLTTQEAMSVIPKLPRLYDEPFADSSQIPTYLVSELARRQVTVSLSGDGGDELFGGYNRYFLGRDLWSKVGWIPSPLRRMMASLIRTVQPETYDRLIGSKISLDKYGIPGAAGDKLYKLAEVLGVKSWDEFDRRLVSHWRQPEELVLGSREPVTAFTNPGAKPLLANVCARMMFIDTITYLPDDILTKVDRASMGVSLEARVPVLDHRVVEFAARIPMSMKIRKERGKWLLRQVLYKYVPQEIVERPKKGFGVPIGAWLRQGLRGWAEDLLEEGRLKRQGILNGGLVRKYWAEHLSGVRNWAAYLWDVLMFQAWWEEWAK
jgi:asparagine synthase (glutamine-hydrolysing)